MKKLTENFESIKSSISETLSGPVGDKLTGHLYYMAAILWFSALRKALKQAIPNIRKESRTGMKIWYIIVTVIVSVAYITNAVSAMKVGDIAMERYGCHKRDLEIMEDLQNEDDFDDEVKPE